MNESGMDGGSAIGPTDGRPGEAAGGNGRGRWGSRLGFVLAASGSAVGLGNIWKFPYITGENGGGLFVLIYLVCIALVGIPIMMAEIMIGRASQRQPVGAFRALQGGRGPWAGIGWLGVIAGFVILSFYVVVAGWALDFTLKSVIDFTEPIHQRAEAEGQDYRARTPVEDARERLIERRIERRLPDAEQAVRSQERPSVWEGHAIFEAALAEHGDTPAVRERLLMDDRLARQVEAAERHADELIAAAADVRAEATAHFAGRPDAEILRLAEADVRRQKVFEEVQAAFLATATDGWTCLLWAGLFMVVTALVVAGGVSRGIEATCRILMPTLVGLMVAMVVYGAFQPGFDDALAFVFRPDASKLEPSGVLEALGHAFFTLSLGMGAMITYGSYQRSREGGLATETFAIAGLDTFIALIACMMMFPIIFSYDQEPGAGPGLVFMSMPLAFSEIGTGGMLLSIVFFGLLGMAALTSTISLLEVIASYFMDERGWSRPRATWAVAAGVFVFALPSMFAMDPGNPMSGWEPGYGQNFFETMDELTSNWMLPLGGLLIAIYAGWVMPRRLQRAEAHDLAPALFTGWVLLIRFVAPALVILVLLQKVGILDADELLHGLL